MHPQAAAHLQVSRREEHDACGQQELAGAEDVAAAHYLAKDGFVILIVHVTPHVLGILLPRGGGGSGEGSAGSGSPCAAAAAWCSGLRARDDCSDACESCCCKGRAELHRRGRKKGCGEAIACEANHGDGS